MDQTRQLHGDQGSKNTNSRNKLSDLLYIPGPNPSCCFSTLCAILEDMSHDPLNSYRETSKQISFLRMPSHSPAKLEQFPRHIEVVLFTILIKRTDRLWL